MRQRHTDRQRDRQTEIQTGMKLDKYGWFINDDVTARQRDRHTDRQTDRETYRETDRQTDILACSLISMAGLSTMTSQ